MKEFFKKNDLNPLTTGLQGKYKFYTPQWLSEKTGKRPNSVYISLK
jgi:hypothetical protein